MTDGPRTELSWSGWGDPAHATALPPQLLELVRAGFGVTRPTPAPASIADVELVAVRLAEPVRAELAALVGEPHARSDHEARARHAVGKSTLELLKLRLGRPLAAPDLVLYPATHDEVVTILARCSDRRVAVVPFGGGTSVVGGLTPEAGGFAGVVALDCGRLNELTAVDEVSLLATLGPGLRGPEAETMLAQRGYTIGHFPQSFQFATLGGFAAARSSGQASAGYGRFDDLVVALKVATPVGTLTLGRAPKSAAGPDLRQLILGSEGALGVITELTVRVRRVPERAVYDGWRIRDFSTGIDLLRRLAQDGPMPTVLRLSDEAETAAGLARPRELGPEQRSGCLAILGYEGTAADTERRRSEAGEILAGAGASPVPGAGEGWARDRYEGPYLRDALIDAGALVETLETACFWSALPALYGAVTTALRESLTQQHTPPVILCHVSHIYASGASLYFTVACAQAGDPVGQWERAKRAANDAIIDNGGSISHHHGVGRDHREWLAREIGELGEGALRSIKEKLDPSRILNPGILIG